MRFPLVYWHQQLNCLAQQFGAGVAKEELRLPVGDDDLALLIGNDRGEGGRLNKPAEAFFTVAQREFRVFAPQQGPGTQGIEGQDVQLGLADGFVRNAIIHRQPAQRFAIPQRGDCILPRANRLEVRI